jgi:hypothetical protein
MSPLGKFRGRGDRPSAGRNSLGTQLGSTGRYEMYTVGFRARKESYFGLSGERTWA